ncbi:MAG TPA: hypothetical protein VGG54_32700 [Trebonia sp.]
MSQPSETTEPEPIDDGQPAGPSEPGDAGDARRLALVAAAQRQWIDGLTDLGDYFPHRGQLIADVEHAHPERLPHLLHELQVGRHPRPPVHPEADHRSILLVS